MKHYTIFFIEGEKSAIIGQFLDQSGYLDNTRKEGGVIYYDISCNTDNEFRHVVIDAERNYDISKVKI